MAQATFYRCNKCGNLFAVVQKGTCVPQCCGEPMEELVAGSVDAAAEKHVPAVTRQDGAISVQVGSVEHPMLDEHHIAWIALSAPDRLGIRFLEPGQKPAVNFNVDVDDVTMYEYCNLHGLWKAEA
ncbi:MAG: desulfoferrodoxin family protein [Coriobacteriales bacterium]|nr:desulfoferrodoxin family protein [Coriobacteriales bacterium]